jgi:hypothetical protein
VLKDAVTRPRQSRISLPSQHLLVVIEDVQCVKSDAHGGGKNSRREAMNGVERHCISSRPFQATVCRITTNATPSLRSALVSQSLTYLHYEYQLNCRVYKRDEQTHLGAPSGFVLFAVRRLPVLVVTPSDPICESSTS